MSLSPEERRARYRTAAITIGSGLLSVAFGATKDLSGGKLASTDIWRKVAQGLLGVAFVCAVMVPWAVRWSPTRRLWPFLYGSPAKRLSPFLYNKVAPVEVADECCVCQADCVKTRVEPCGHACLCFGCASRLVAIGCPLCREDIAAVLYWV